MKTQGYVKLIHSVGGREESILELNVLPGEKTPWHYHTMFAETFEILKGTLEVGRGKDIIHLEQGDVATIQPNQKHYYHNTSKEECVVRTSISPSNKDFENSILILKGLANDGLASAAGTPRNFFDLVLFVHLSNSRMVGIQKIAEPLFALFAGVAIKNGRLNKLMEKYCK